MPPANALDADALQLLIARFQVLHWRSKLPGAQVGSMPSMGCSPRLPLVPNPPGPTSLEP